MRVCVLDGKEISDRKILHETLAGALGFPDWYGKNLDALYDCLTDGQEEIQIVLRNQRMLKEHLGRYASSLVRVLSQASEECPKIHLKEQD